MARLFSNRPMSGELSASAAVEGTLATVARGPDPCCTKLPAICLNSRYLVTLVETRMLVSSPLAISSFGTRSTFQSLTRPYFFHGSSPSLKLPYFLNSYSTSEMCVRQTGSMDVQPRCSRKRPHCHARQSCSMPAGKEGLLPAIVVVTIDVQNLLSFDTEDAIETSVKLRKSLDKSTNPESTHSVRPGTCQHCWRGKSAGFAADYVPVPSTTTSYSGAISSMMISEQC